MNKKTSMLTQIISIVLYVVAIVFLIFAVWSGIESGKYISEGLAMGQIDFGAETFNVISYVFSSFANHLASALLMIGVGRCLQLLSIKQFEAIDEEVESTTEKAPKEEKVKKNKEKTNIDKKESTEKSIVEEK